MRDDDVVLFLGDELTDTPEPRTSHQFPFLVETFLAARYPELRARFVSVGWSGDTVGRALLRLERDVLSRKPTVVVVCLGLNDPEYLPFARERLDQFRKDLASLIGRLRQAGARVWLISPPAVREDLGTNARILRDGQASVVNLQAIRYNATLALYTAAMREVALGSASGFVNGYAASLNRQPSDGSPAAGPWRDGRVPPPQGHALVATQLLRAWGAAPIQVNIRINWNAPSATVTRHDRPPEAVPVELRHDGRRILLLKDMPLPWPLPAGRIGALQPARETAEMCQYTLHVPDPPARGVALHLEAGQGTAAGALTLSAVELTGGFSLATAEPFRAIRPVQDLLQTIGLKNFYHYSTWRRQELNPPREPELAQAQRQLVAALYAYAAGYERLIQRLPRTFSARIVLAEVVPPERVPTAPPPAAWPATLPSTIPASMPATRPATRPATQPG